MQTSAFAITNLKHPLLNNFEMSAQLQRMVPSASVDTNMHSLKTAQQGVFSAELSNEWLQRGILLMCHVFHSPPATHLPL